MEIIDLIGTSEGSVKPFEQWRMEALQAGLQPAQIQRLKRQGLLHTRFNAQGVLEVVRGANPNKGQFA